MNKEQTEIFMECYQNRKKILLDDTISVSEKLSALEALYILTFCFNEENEQNLSIRNQLLSEIESYIDEEPEEYPKVLRLDDHSLERGKALSQALSYNINTYREGLQRQRENKYEEMINEMDPVESPLSRSR